MESRISLREEVEEILKCLGERLSPTAQVLIICDAAMLEYGLKDVTKDIDLVCMDAAGKIRNEPEAVTVIYSLILHPLITEAADDGPSHFSFFYYYRD